MPDVQPSPDLNICTDELRDPWVCEEHFAFATSLSNESDSSLREIHVGEFNTGGLAYSHPGGEHQRNGQKRGRLMGAFCDPSDGHFPVVYIYPLTEGLEKAI